MRHTLSIMDGPRPRETTWRGDYRPSGGDSALSRNPDALAWLAKVHAEHVQGKRAWDDLFNVEDLARFLIHYGVDLEAAQKADADAALDVPAEMADVQSCLPGLSGASFLKASPAAVCTMIERRHKVARIRGR